MLERIYARHPDPEKEGTNIDAEKYQLVRDAIEASLHERDVLTFAELTEEVTARVGDEFEGSVSWFVTTVKLDLESRGVIERVKGAPPQKLRLVE